jgi:hypothetical protein
MRKCRFAGTPVGLGIRVRRERQLFLPITTCRAESGIIKHDNYDTRGRVRKLNIESQRRNAVTKEQNSLFFLIDRVLQIERGMRCTVIIWV